MIKAAIEREKSDARISSSECEQARRAASMFNVQFEKFVFFDVIIKNCIDQCDKHVGKSTHTL